MRLALTGIYVDRPRRAVSLEQLLIVRKTMSSSWACATCTYNHTGAAAAYLACGACGTTRPGDENGALVAAHDAAATPSEQILPADCDASPAASSTAALHDHRRRDRRPRYGHHPRYGHRPRNAAAAPQRANKRRASTSSRARLRSRPSKSASRARAKRWQN